MECWVEFAFGFRSWWRFWTLLGVVVVVVLWAVLAVD